MEGYNNHYCVICFDDISDHIITYKCSCNNIFHKSCLLNWLETFIGKGNCPLCKTNLSINGECNIIENRASSDLISPSTISTNSTNNSNNDSNIEVPLWAFMIISFLLLLSITISVSICLSMGATH